MVSAENQLPLVALLGDSIRMGYQSVVVRELEGVAEVWAPEENGAHIKHTRSRLETWFADREPALVHINVGLHDMWVQEDGTNRHPLPEYLVGLREILEWLRDHTEARVVFALTTPVDQERQRQSNYGRVVRRNEDIPAYNTPTRALVESLDMGVDDLYGVVMAVGVDNVIADDGVHFRPEGYELLGKAVAACILRELST
jgi:lysophospholipase L1-like esterase